MVVTVTGGEGLTINGSSNTFFYDKVKAGASKTVTVPMKVANTDRRIPRRMYPSISNTSISTIRSALPLPQT